MIIIIIIVIIPPHPNHSTTLINNHQRSSHNNLSLSHFYTPKPHKPAQNNNNPQHFRFCYQHTIFHFASSFFWHLSPSPAYPAYFYFNSSSPLHTHPSPRMYPLAVSFSTLLILSSTPNTHTHKHTHTLSSLRKHTTIPLFQCWHSSSLLIQPHTRINSASPPSLLHTYTNSFIPWSLIPTQTTQPCLHFFISIPHTTTHPSTSHHSRISTLRPHIA